MPNSKAAVKILHILDHSLPVHSGYSFRSHEIFQAQRKRGWRPVILTSPKHSEAGSGANNGKEIVDGISYYRTGAESSATDSIGSVARFTAVLARRIREIIELERPDLLHCHSPVLNVIPALWIGRQLGIPVIYEVRAFWEDAAVDHGTYSRDSWKYKLVRALETFVCGRAQAVIVICRGLENDLVQRGIRPEKINVVCNGINAENFQSAQPRPAYADEWDLKGRKVIGFVGSFYRYEGLDLLIDAFSRLSAARSDVVLVLVGGGSMETELRAQVERLGLGGKVIIPGRIPHERIPSIYALMDVLVYPRYAARLTDLVTPLKPLEAMAMGKAVVASDVGGHRELIQHGSTGVLFPSGDAGALVTAIERVLDDEPFRNALESQGTTWVRRCRTWDAITAIYSDVYSRILGAAVA